jgi:hypothetical protein
MELMKNTNYFFSISICSERVCGFNTEAASQYIDRVGHAPGKWNAGCLRESGSL